MVFCYLSMNLNCYWVAPSVCRDWDQPSADRDWDYPSADHDWDYLSVGFAALDSVCQSACLAACRSVGLELSVWLAACRLVGLEPLGSLCQSACLAACRSVGLEPLEFPPDPAEGSASAYLTKPAFETHQV